MAPGEPAAVAAESVGAEPAGAAPDVDVRGAAEALWSSREPLLIGVRHHSPALAAVVGELLDGFAPDRLLIELPPELAPWLEWLAHPDTIAPVALAAVRQDGGGLSFYPFADFSPELATPRADRTACPSRRAICPGRRGCGARRPGLLRSLRPLCPIRARA